MASVAFVVVCGVWCLLCIAMALHSVLPRRTPHRTALSNPKDRRFPDGFWWGTACADQQVEHQQPSDWTAFELRARQEGKSATANDGHSPRPGHIRGITSVPLSWVTRKANFDEQYLHDFDAAKAMGHRFFRLSLSWSRLFPSEAHTTPDPHAVDFYQRMLDALRARDLAPFVTLHHFATPGWLSNVKDGRRGLLRKDAPEHFVRFAEAAANAFGDRVSYWCTVNEPTVVAYQGYMIGVFPPNEQHGPLGLLPVVQSLVQFHNQAAPVLRSVARRRHSEAHVGVAQHVRTFMPWRNHSVLDRITALAIDRAFVHLYLQQTINNSDYLGINYYGRYYVKATGLGTFEILGNDPAEDERAGGSQLLSDLGWPTDNAGFEATLCDLAKRYKKPIFVLENGFADNNHADVRRQQFLRGQIDAMHRAIQQGVDVRGYAYWSLTDNFEWAEGFDPRFGLYHVDYDNDGLRTARDSVEFYRRIATDNALPPMSST